MIAWRAALARETKTLLVRPSSRIRVGTKIEMRGSNLLPKGGAITVNKSTAMFARRVRSEFIYTDNIEHIS